MNRRLALLATSGFAISSFALAGLAMAAPPARPSDPAPGASACPPGFSALQGSDTCVRVSGRVRAEGVMRSSRARDANGFATGASGRVQLDVRKQTEYGPLRAVIRAEGQRQ